MWVSSEEPNVRRAERSKSATEVFAGGVLADLLGAGRTSQHKSPEETAKPAIEIPVRYSRGQIRPHKESNLAGNPEPPAPKPLARGLATFYEAVAFETLRTLWRGRLVIAAFLLAGLALSLVSVLFSTKRYTSDAVIQLDFAQEEAGKAKPPPVAALEAGVLVEGEARIVRSPAMARRVAARLKLDQDPAYASPGLLARLLGVLQAPPPGAPRPSNVELAARNLAKKLAVSNDARSYLINISVTSGSPVEAARLANAFAVEYLNDRVIQRLRAAEGAARNTLSDAVVTYGDRHPVVAQARANLASAEHRLNEQQRLSASAVDPDELMALAGQGLTKAEPVALPSGPNPVAILGAGIVASLAVGAALILLLERRDTGFRTEHGVSAATGVRCMGMIPATPKRASAQQLADQRESLRSLCVATGLAGQSPASFVVMVTCALPAESKSNLVEKLARSLSEEGRRVLIVDTTPSSHMGAGPSIDDVLGHPELIHQILAEQEEQPIAELRRSSGLNGAFNPFASFASLERDMGQLLAEARHHFHVILLEAPPAILSAECVFLGRFADLSLLVADWKHTPRASVTEAVRRMQDNDLRIDGVVLAEVDLNAYPSYAAGDRLYYASRFRGGSA